MGEVLRAWPARYVCLADVGDGEVCGYIYCVKLGCKRLVCPMCGKDTALSPAMQKGRRPAHSKASERRGKRRSGE